MTIDCRQFQKLLESDLSREDPALIEHLDHCPACVAWLEHSHQQARQTFPAQAWETPPAFSPRLIPVAKPQRENWFQSFLNWVNDPSHLWRPAFGGMVLAGLLIVALSVRSPAPTVSSPETPAWSFLPPSEMLHQKPFLNDIPVEEMSSVPLSGADGSFAAIQVPAAEAHLESTTEDSGFVPQEDWSFLDSGSSYTFIDDEEETS